MPWDERLDRRGWRSSLEPRYPWLNTIIGREVRVGGIDSGRTLGGEGRGIVLRRKEKEGRGRPRRRRAMLLMSIV